MPQIIPIGDPHDPRIAAYADIRERDLVGRQGLFVAEGEVVLRTLLGSSRHQPVSLLVAEKRLAGLAPLIADLPEEVPVYAATQEIVDGVVGFSMHRGILAIGRREPERPAAEIFAGCGAKALVVVAFGIANHDNMGGIFRNAAAFAADAVILDEASVDPLYRKAIRVSVGATLTVPFARIGREDDVLALLAAAGFEAIALSPLGATTLAELRPAPRTAILLGSEGPGLPAALLARTRTVRIPMAKGFDSLNVATASGIVLHHCRFG